MNTDYTVFIDESFSPEWFGFSDMDADLCYGVLTIPTAKILQLDKFENHMRKLAYKFLYKHLQQKIKEKCSVSEFKYSYFNALLPNANIISNVMDTLGNEFSCFLKENDARLFGFYIPLYGFLHYTLRDEYFDKASTLKSMTQSEINKHIENIKNEKIQEWKIGVKNGKRNVELLRKIYEMLFMFIGQFHGQRLNKTFEIVYDSRDSIEDAVLHEYALELAQLAERVFSGVSSSCKNIKMGSSSNYSGIRIADWIAGDVRKFFRKNQTLLDDGSKLEILPAVVHFYRKELSAETGTCFCKLGQGTMLPQIKDYFAADTLTCFARYGEARHINIPLRIALDLAD